MASNAQVKRYQDELKRLRGQLARESAKIGPAHQKAAQARIDAGKTKSVATAKTKMSVAEREDRKAHDAEKARATVEKKIADAESRLVEAQRKYAQDTEREQKRTLDRLTATVHAREAQFRPSTRDVFATSPARADLRSQETDLFMSHASEDKDDVVRPLQALLEERGVTTWLDELNIGWGQSIRQSIDTGIANCRYGLVVISPNFIAKHWTKTELDALFGRQLGEFRDGGFILPVWHHISADEVQQSLPTIAGLKAMNTAIFTLDEVADEVAKLVHG